jgi:processive 1,2-diacylglycerol beta-glucosyltransferase
LRRVLIFSASTGGGHNQVAAVLRDELEQNGYETTVIDFLKESNRFLDFLLASGYNHLAVRSARLYGLIYRTSNNKRVDTRLKAVLSRILRNKINAAVISFHPDLIICTHPIIVNVLGLLKARSQVVLPVISVITDFDAHHMYISKYIDAYITTPCIETKKALLQGGIAENKIFPCGIPVKRDFFRQPERFQSAGRFSVLLMGGSLGGKYLARVINVLLDNPHPLKITVVCGRNYRLKRNLQLKYQNIPSGKEIIIYGFCHNIAELMDSADLLISKPGGITTSEAIAKQLPILIPYAIPGQEEENARILAENHLALKAGKISEINPIISGLINDSGTLREISKNMENLSGSNSLDTFMALSERLIDGFKASSSLPGAR